MVRKLVYVVCLLLLGARMTSAQSTGSIAGTVTDTTGAVLPGVTVEVSSPALIEKTRATVTDSAGAYKIEALRPGAYTVTFRLSGFSTVQREGIELSSGFTATISAQLRVGSVEETITVTGAAPSVDTHNVTARAVFTSEVLDNVVMSKSTVGFAAVLLGATVTTGIQDVAGATGEFPSQISIRGGRDGDQIFTWDGLRMYTLSNGTGSGFYHSYYPNMLLVQEATFETSNAPAMYEVGGIQTNYVPKDGGNRFSGTALANYSGPKLQNKNLDDDLRARGLVTEPGKIRKVYDVGGGIGGPVVRDRLWFYGATHFWGSQNTIAGTYFNKTQDTGIYTPDLSRPGYQSLLLNEPFAGRLMWQASSKQKVTFQYGQQPQCLCFYALGANVTPEAALNQHYTHNYSTQGTWSYVRTSRLLFQGGVSASNAYFDTTPTEGVARGALSYLELPAAIFYNNLGFTAFSEEGTFGHQHSSGQSAALKGSYVTGSHAATVGFTWFGGTVDNLVGYPKELIGLPATIFTFRAGPNAVFPILVQEKLSSTSDARVNANLGIFAQDQWTMRRVTVNAGLRFDYLNAASRAHCRPADLYTPERCSPGAKNSPNWTDLNPRVGLAYDIFGNGRTAVKVALGRYVNTEALTIARNNDPLSNQNNPATLRSMVDLNGNFRPDCDLANPAANGECGAIFNPLFGTPVQQTRTATSYSEGFGKRGYTWQGQASVQQELRPGLALTVGYYRTSFGNFVVADNVNVTPADFDPFCITVPTDSRLPNSGTQSCGWYDMTPAALARGPSNLIRPASDFRKEGITKVYDGVELQTNWRFGKGGLLQGGISLGRTETDQCFVVDSPQQLKDCDLVLGWAAQRQVKFLGSYPMPGGVMISGTFQHLPGIPQNAALTLSGTQALSDTTLGRLFSGGQIVTSTTGIVGTIAPGAAAEGTGTGDLFTPNTKFDEALNQVDLRLTKDFRFGTRRLRGIVDIGNLFNANPILAVQTSYTQAGWLTPASVLAARIVKFGVSVDF